MNHTHTIASVDNHRHTVNPPSTQTGGNDGTPRVDGYQTGGNYIAPWGHKHWVDIAQFNSGWAGSHNHGGATGSGGSLPPYYALAFIIKLEE